MTAELTALKKAYEDEGMSPEEISEDRDLELASVKAGLMQVSSKYRKACGHEDEELDVLNYSKDEQRRVKDAILDLGLSAEDEHLRFKALTYVRDDSKGRKDVVKAMGGNNFNILFINEQMQRVRLAAQSVKQKVLQSPQQAEVVNV